MDTESSLVWRGGDEEKGEGHARQALPTARDILPRLERRSSSHRRTIDPAAALPIQYRSV